jgi:hypothetical protein
MNKRSGRGAVYKYPLSLASGDSETSRGVLFRLPIPPTSEILCVQMQGNTPTLWALVPPIGDTLDTRTFRLVMTGEDSVYPGDVYVGTVQDGPWVYHVFEVAF